MACLTVGTKLNMFCIGLYLKLKTVKLGHLIFRWIHNCSVVHRARNFLHWFEVVSTGRFQLHYTIPYIAVNTHFVIDFWILLLWSVLTGRALACVFRCTLVLYTVHKVCRAITCVILVISSSACSLSRLVECQLYVLTVLRSASVHSHSLLYSQ